MFLIDVVKTLKKEKVKFALVGGYAIALHGVVRGTIDIDLILDLGLRSFNRAEQALSKIGLVSRLPVTGGEVFQFREEYIKNRNLIAWSFYDPKDPSRVLDIILTEDIKKKRIVFKTVADQKVPVLSISDLIFMKQAAGRPQDLEDVKALKALGEL